MHRRPAGQPTIFSWSAALSPLAKCPCSALGLSLYDEMEGGVHCALPAGMQVGAPLCPSCPHHDVSALEPLAVTSWPAASAHI